MRVAVVLRETPQDWGGTFTFSRGVLNALRGIEAQTQHEFVYYSSGPSDDPKTKVIPPSEPPLQAPPPGIKRLASSVREQFSPAPPPPPKSWLELSLEQEGIDLVWFADTYAAHCELPYVFTVFDIEHLRQPWFPEVTKGGVWEDRLEFFSLHISRATRVIVPNEVGAEQLMHYFPIEGERLLTLPHPTPDFALEAAGGDPPSAALLTEHGIEEPYLLYPAQFWPHKNHVTLIEALAELNRAGDRFALVLTGSDKNGQLAYVQSLVEERSLADRVHFLGLVSTPELVNLYEHAFALTYMSMFGPENLPPLEAMALGCPVIAADVPGAEEQMGSAALRVPPMDASELAEAVRSLNDPAARKRLIEAGRERARKWTTGDYVRAVVGFLDEFEQTRLTWS